MSGISSRGRRGSVIVPNFRWEDPELDSYDLHVAGWLASHTDGYLADHVTRNAVAKATGISGERVSKSLERLAKASIIEIRDVAVDQAKGGHRWVITFDWEAWETPVAARPPWSLDDHPPVATRPGPGRHATSTKGAQEEEQEEPRRTAPPAESPSGFDAFWSEYPRKIDKAAARRAWKTATKQSTEGDILGGLVRWKLAWVAAGTAPEYIPHPTTWLNRHRWESTPDIGTAAKTGADPLADAIRQHLAASGIDVESRMDDRERADFDARLTKAVTAVSRMGYDDGEILLRAALVAKHDWTDLVDPIMYARRNEVARFRGMPKPQVEGETVLDAMRRTRNIGRWVQS